MISILLSPYPKGELQEDYWCLGAGHCATRSPVARSCMRKELALFCCLQKSEDCSGCEDPLVTQWFPEQRVQHLFLASRAGFQLCG